MDSYFRTQEYSDETWLKSVQICYQYQTKQILLTNVLDIICITQEVDTHYFLIY